MAVGSGIGDDTVTWRCGRMPGKAVSLPGHSCVGNVFSFRNPAENLSRYPAEIRLDCGQLMRLLCRVAGGVREAVQDSWRDVSVVGMGVAKLMQEALKAAFAWA